MDQALLYQASYKDNLPCLVLGTSRDVGALTTVLEVASRRLKNQFSQNCLEVGADWDSRALS